MATFTGRKNGFAQICSMQMYRKNVKLRSKYGAEMINATFAYQNVGCVNNLANMAFTIFATHLFLRFLLCRYICNEQLRVNSFFDPVFSINAIEL